MGSVIIWLGSVIDTNQGTIAATPQRMLKLAILTDFFIQCESRVLKARDLASFIGMITVRCFRLLAGTLGAS